MRNIKSRRKLILGGILGALLVAAILIISFAARPIEDKTNKIQPDWSRGIRVGRSPWNQPPTLCVSDDGRHVHLAWSDNRRTGVGVHYLQLDEHARPVAENWSEPLQGTPLSAQIMLDPQGRPHMWVLARWPGESATRLVHWSLSADGSQRIPAHPISPAGIEVTSFAATPGQSDSFWVFWSADAESSLRGLYVTRLNVDGQPVGDHRRLNERPADQVSAQADDQGNSHVIWGESFSGPTIGDWYRTMYAVFLDNTLQPSDGVFIEESDGPARLGLDRQRVYAWRGKEIKGGMLAGMGFTSYTSFPLGQPESRTSSGLSIPAEGRPDYLPYQGEFHFKTLARVGPVSPGDNTDYLHSPAPLPGQHDTMAVATVAALSVGLNDRVLPTLVILRDGHVIGYQVMALNDGYNARPVLAADGTGDLYAAWLTGSTGAGFRIYYAATTTAARAQLDANDLTDYVVAGAATAWQMLGGLALLPLFPLIILPTLVIVVVYSIWGQRGEGFTDRWSYVFLVVSCLAYWLTKEVLLGSVLTETTLAHGLAGWSRTFVIWGVQLAIATVSGVFTWWLVKRRQLESFFWPVLIFVACDMILTLLAAGPTLAQRG